MSININIEKLDKIIFGFMILFAATLNNSIFFCQIGFFGAYLLVALRYFLTKQNPFVKTGLEIPFLFYFGAVLVSAFFSIDKSSAFIELIKNFLLLPIIYLIIYSASSPEKAKTIYKVYLGAALATLLVYLFFSLKHYFTQLYQLELKGPSPFQYVMTAGGLMSFTAIFFFAFLINEKTNWKWKLFYLLSFGISFAAVMASYTRAAWLGMFVGLFIVLIIKKKWWIVIPVFLLIPLLLLTKSNESKIQFYSLDGNKLKEIKTEGRAYSVLLGNQDSTYVADYEKGISVFTNGKLTQTLNYEAPITRINKWKDNSVVVFTLDSRFVVVNNFNSFIEKIDTAFYTTGKTKDYTLSNNNLYVADSDSGLYVYDLQNGKVTSKLFSNKNGVATVAADSNRLAYYEERTEKLVLSVENNAGKYSIIDSIKIPTSIKYLWFIKNILLFQTDKELIQFKIEDNKLIEIQRDKLVGITRLKTFGDDIYAITINGLVYKGNYLKEQKAVSFVQIINVGHPVIDFDIHNDQIAVTSFSRNRIASIFDPNHETNFERLNIWKTGLKIFYDYPFFGVGDIDLGKIYGQYKDKFLKENFGHLHNNFLHWLVTLGIIGFSAIMYLMFSIMLMHFKIYKQLKAEPYVSSFSLGAIATFFAFIFSGLGEYNFGDQEILTMVYFILGTNLTFYFNYLRKQNKA